MSAVTDQVTPVSANTQPQVTRDETLRVLRRAVPKGKMRRLGIFFGVLADISVVGLLGLSMWLIVRAGEQPPILHLTFAIVGVRAFAIGRAAFRYAERLSSHDAAFAQLATLRAETFEALIPRVPGGIPSARRGDVLSAFVDDVDQLQDEPLRVRQPLIVSLTVVVLSTLLLALISPTAALILVVALVIAGSVSIWVSQRLAARSDREMTVARAALSDALLERFSAASVLTAYGALDRQRDRIAAAEERLASAQLTRTRAAGLTGAILSLAAGLASVLTLVTLMPGLDLADPAISAPLFATAVIVPAAVFEIFAQVPPAVSARRTVMASAERVAALTETPLPAELPAPAPVVTGESVGSHVSLSGDAGAAPGSPAGEKSALHPRSAASPQAAPLVPLDGAPLISVRNLSARHPGQTSDAFSGISFDLRAGEVLVVTGESGRGKSTLALVLARLLNYRGSYLVGGHEATTIAPEQVRQMVGLIEQQPHLFDADIRQNLKFARDTATDAELEAVLARVGLADWVAERGGLDVEVGERGDLVSGGQAQRIGLARAILADFPVVILDEPTASVDRERADQLLRDLLGAVPEDRAVILITHTQLPEGIEAATLAL
ncbi:MAG: thiol reductant ABC exporter subunit CydC [Microbacteriaceae bacterium]|nr:thiol reductant ABC exporter subunit CydC [Microbacteriaceae bacterium]